MAGFVSVLVSVNDQIAGYVTLLYPILSRWSFVRSRVSYL